MRRLDRIKIENELENESIDNPTGLKSFLKFRKRRISLTFRKVRAVALC